MTHGLATPTQTAGSQSSAKNTPFMNGAREAVLGPAISAHVLAQPPALRHHQPQQPSSVLLWGDSLLGGMAERDTAEGEGARWLLSPVRSQQPVTQSHCSRVKQELNPCCGGSGVCSFR